VSASGHVGSAPDNGASARPRQRNRRGQGHRLRDEIIAGAADLIERTGSEESITLRSVARQIGIAAPSIAPHFADRYQIIDAVVAAELEALTRALTDGASRSSDPVERLLNACRAYVAFGRSHPNRYRVLYERRYLDEWDDEGRPMVETSPVMARNLELSVGLVQACVDARRSASTDAQRDTYATWMFLHGLVALPLVITSLPWPDTDSILVDGVARLARLTPRVS
jgi:AcrR family transcriptional regulator